MTYELVDNANDADTGESDAASDGTSEWDSDNSIDDESLTEMELIQKAREILAEWKDWILIDPLMSKEIEDAYNLLSRALESRDTEVIEP